MPKKLYKYTRYNTDGTIQVLEPRPKMTLAELQKEVGGYIEIVHTDYYPEGVKWGHCTCYIDEEGRFREDATVNPHFRDFGEPWNIVGIVLKEEVFHDE